MLEVDDDVPPALLKKEKAGTLTPAESKELKRQRRILKNRLAAQMFRKRQREHLEELEVQAVDEQNKNDEYKQQVAQLEEKNSQVRERISKVVESIVTIGSTP